MAPSIESIQPLGGLVFPPPVGFKMPATLAVETNGHASNGAEEKEYAPIGSIPETRDLYESKPDRHGRTSWTTEYPDDLNEPPENAESAQYALLVRHKKCYDGRKKLEIDSIVVQNQLLKKVLGIVLKDYPGISTNLERVEFHAPFEPFVHRWEAFAEARETEVDTETKAHVELLWRVLEEELRDTIREKNDHVANGVVRFDNIWTIFEPSTLVFSRDEDQERVYRLKTGNFANTRCGRVYALQVEFVDWDGENFGYGRDTLQIRAFCGTQLITKLFAYPLSHHATPESLKEKLIARGRLFEKYKGYHYKQYEGIGIGWSPFGPVRYSVNSRIIIDTYAFNRFNPNRKVHLDYLSIDEDVEEDSELEELEPDQRNGKNTIRGHLNDEQFLICTASLRGYSLKDKKWLEFFIDDVKAIIWNEQAFASLVAPPEQKELILAFAQSQAKNKNQFDDVIQGKGCGIIMLLSGPPGVGKTLTAESVAETMKVPLYMLSAGTKIISLPASIALSRV